MRCKKVKPLPLKKSTREKSGTPGRSNAKDTRASHYKSRTGNRSGLGAGACGGYGQWKVQADVFMFCGWCSDELSSWNPGVITEYSGPSSSTKKEEFTICYQYFPPIKRDLERHGITLKIQWNLPGFTEMLEAQGMATLKEAWLTRNWKNFETHRKKEII